MSKGLIKVKTTRIKYSLKDIGPFLVHTRPRRRFVRRPPGKLGGLMSLKAHRRPGRNVVLPALVLAGVAIAFLIPGEGFAANAASQSPRLQTLPAALRPALYRALAEDAGRSEEHTSELQSRGHLVCRLLLEKK